MKPGGCVGGPCGDSGFTTKPAPPVKPVPGVPGVPGVGGDGNVSPPTPPATPATPTPATPAASNCCQTLGSCPEGYQSSGTVVPNTACCKDLSKGISISSDMPYCPTTGDGIGPITTPKIGPIETGNPNGMGMDMGNMGNMGEHVGGYKTHGY